MSTSTVAQYTTEIPKVLEPFYSTPGTGLIPRGISAIFPGGLSGQAAYQAQYSPVIQAGLMGAGSIAGLSPFQTAVGEQLGTMGLPGQYQLATQAGQQAAAGFQGLQNVQAPSVTPDELTYYQLGSSPTVSARGLTNYQMGAAPTVSARGLTNYQMGAAPTVSAQDLTQYQMEGPSAFTADVAKQYMSPYMQAVVDRQQQAAITAAQQAQLGQNLAAARQGTYGGARQAILQRGREDALKTQLGDIQAKGLQSAYEQAQAQFERDRAAQIGVGSQNLQARLGVQQLGAGQSLQAALANQAAQQAAQQANLQASLGVQQLGSGQELQAALANQAAQQAAQQANLQASLGVQQLGSGQELQAALANQAAQQAAQQANLQASLGVQQLGAGQSLSAQQANQQAALQAAQQRLAASQGLSGLAGTFGQLGTQQLAGQLDLTKTQGAFGDLQRAIQQQQMDAQRQMLMEQAQYGQTQVGQLSGLLRGIPMTSATQTTTTPPPSFASQLTGLGLTGLGLYNMLGGGKS